MEDFEKKYNEALERAKKSLRAANDDGRDVVGFIFPELRESEDERIIKILLEFIHCWGDDFFSEKEERRDCVAWLEKQKDRSSDKEDIVAISHLCNKGYAVVAPMGRWETGRQDYSGLTDFERAIHRGFLCAGVENVPVTIIKETAQECLAQMKPAEWSEEDEDRIRQIERIAQQAGCTQKLQEEIHDWFKSLRPSWKPREEASNNFELALAQVIKEVVETKSGGPSLKEYAGELYEVAKRELNHWQPSEEQIECLRKVVYDAEKKHAESTSGYDDFIILRSLLQELIRQL